MESYGINAYCTRGTLGHWETLFRSSQRNAILQIIRRYAVGYIQIPQLQVAHLPRSHAKPIRTLTNPIRTLIALFKTLELEVSDTRLRMQLLIAGDDILYVRIGKES